MGIVLDDDFVVAAIDGNFHRPRGLRRSLVLINLDAVALKGGEEIVDFFGGMDLCRKRIVYFVVEQVAPLFAHGNELPYCIIFFFKAYCCHKFLPITCRNSRHSPDRPESAFSHGVAAFGIGACFYRSGTPKRVWVAGMFCSVIPDFDVIGFRLGIHYGDFWGLRGFTHSLLFAALLASIVMFIGFRRVAS